MNNNNIIVFTVTYHTVKKNFVPWEKQFVEREMLQYFLHSLLQKKDQQNFFMFSTSVQNLLAQQNTIAINVSLQIKLYTN